MESSQEEAVLHWLKKRGYTNVVKHYEEDQAKGEGGVTSTGRKRANVDAGLFKSQRVPDPDLLNNSYNELQTWICNALEAYKPELLTVTFPIFVHCYLKLIERNQTEAASEFYRKWSTEHEDYYSMELRSLSIIQHADQMESNNYVKRCLSDKFVIHLCTTSYRLLQSFLSDHNLLSLMEILNERVKVYIEERSPKEKFEVVTFMSEAVAGGGNISRKDLHLRHISLLPSVKWRVQRPSSASKEQQQAIHQSLPSSTPYNQHVSAKLLRHPHKFLLNDMYQRQYEHTTVKADLQTPTVLMATLTNSYDGMITARITDDATQIAAGFQDRCIRVFRLLDSPSLDFPAAEVDQEEEEEGNASRSSPLFLRGHSQPVYGLSWSPEAQYLVSSAGDGSVRLWDVGLARNLAIYRHTPTFPVWDVAYAPLGQYFVAGYYDRTARIWSTAHTQPLRLLVGHYSDVSTVCWHPNCNYVVTGSWDKTVRLWDVQSGRCLRIYAGHFGPLTALAVSPDGHYIAGAGPGKGTTAAAEAVIRLWEISSGKEVTRMVGHQDRINRLAFSADGAFLASAGADDSLRTWEVHAASASSSSEETLGGGSSSSSLTRSPHSTFRTRGTPVVDVNFTPHNLLLACGAT